MIDGYLVWETSDVFAQLLKNMRQRLNP